MMSSNWNIFRVTGPLWREFTGKQRIPLTMASGAGLLMFSLLCAWTDGCANTDVAGDFRHHDAHCDVNVMFRNISGSVTLLATDLSVFKATSLYIYIYIPSIYITMTSYWVRLNHRRLDCLLNRLLRRRSMKTSKFRATGLCAGNPPENSPNKGPVTRKMFPFDDVIMVVPMRLALARQHVCLDIKTVPVFFQSLSVIWCRPVALTIIGPLQ